MTRAPRLLVLLMLVGCGAAEVGSPSEPSALEPSAPPPVDEPASPDEPPGESANQPPGVCDSSPEFVVEEGWWNAPAVELATDTVEFSFRARAATPSIDALVGVSRNDASTWSDTALSVRFSDAGVLDVRDGAAYRADRAVAWDPGRWFQFWVRADIGARTYSVDVGTCEEEREVLIADAGFREGTGSFGGLDRLALWSSGDGTLEVSAVEWNAAPAAELPPAGNVACPAPEILDYALDQDLVWFDRQLSGGAHSWSFHGGEIGLLMGVACGAARVDARALAQVRHLLTAGNGPTSPGGYADQHQLASLALMSLALKTPRIASELTPDEQGKIELMLEASLIANAWLNSDENPFVKGAGPQRAIDGDTNVSRSWNPNFRNGNLGSLIVALGHFGATRAEQILDGHDQSEFEDRLESHQLDNLLETHQRSGSPSDPQIESALRAPYSAFDISLSDILGLYFNLTDDTYSKTVGCGLNGGAGIFGGGYVENCDGLPNVGQLGMLKEFDSNDANGQRSSATYAYDGLRPNATIHLYLLAIGAWDGDRLGASAVLDRMRVGVEDFFFKIDPARGGGYRNYARGSTRGTTTFDEARGHGVTEELVRLILRHHDS